MAPDAATDADYDEDNCPADVPGAGHDPTPNGRECRNCWAVLASSRPVRRSSRASRRPWCSRCWEVLRMPDSFPATAATTGNSYVVARDGLNGKREHWMPGNFRRGTGPREKRPFDSEQAALEALGDRGGHVYQCSICDKWHRASEPKA